MSVKNSKLFGATVGAILLAGLSACGKAPETSDTKIVNGLPAGANEWNAVVGLVSRNEIFCTGTAISPRLIVTAAHCLEAFPPSVISIYVGNGSIESGVRAQYQVASGNIHPTYGARTGAHDVAYLTTDRDMTGIKFPEVLIDADEERSLLGRNTKSTLVGFGFRGKNPFGSQTNSVGERLSGAKYVVDVKVLGQEQNHEVLVDANNRGACKGDSGGPAFGILPNGQLRVYGVTSRANAMGTPLCGNPDIPTVYGLIKSSICWIQSDSGQTVPGKAKEFCQSAPDTGASESRSFGPFANNLREELVLTVNQGNKVSFDLDVSMEDGYDFVIVTTGDGRRGEYTGKRSIRFDSLVTPVKVLVTTDKSEASPGFKVKNARSQ